jgi:quercetin dioxygenase-like cupin family protein
MRKILGLALATVFIGSASLAAPNPSQPPVKRTDLQRHDLSIPGHRHPGEEVIYVLEGVLEYQLEGQGPVTLRPGQVLFVPSGVAHKAHNPGTTNGAELATYIVEKGKPLVVLAPEVAESR